MWGKIKSFLFKNTTAKQTVAKNTFWLSVSNFGGRIIKAALVIYAARALGASEYGVFSYAVTLAGFVGTFMDPGVNSVLIRDATKVSDNERRSIFSATILIKAALIVCGVCIVVLIAPHFSTLPGAAILLPAAAVILAFDTIRELLFAFLRSREKMQWDAGIFLFTNFAIVVFGFIFLFRNPTALGLAWGYAVGTLLGGILAIAITWKDIVKATSRFSTRLVGPILQSAWPFAITGALGLLFTNMDILIISWMKTSADVGIYSAAIRIIQVLYIIPYIVQTSTLPIFSRLAQKNSSDDRATFRTALEQTISLIFVIALPLAVGGIILGTQIMTLIFGAAFASGSAAFKLLCATLIVDYAGSIIVNAIFAYGQQKSLILSSAIGGITNVVFDLALIPRFGMTGSAVATLIAQIITNWYIWHMMRKINYFEILPHLKKMATATVIMGIITLALYFAGVNVIVNILISGTVYLACLRIFREPVLREIKHILARAA